MKTNSYLLPARFKTIGWTLSVLSAFVLLSYLFDGFGVLPEFLYKALGNTYLSITGNLGFTDICSIVLVVGLLVTAFSKEKTEDEYITKLRSDSLIWAVIANSILLVVLMTAVRGFDFIYVSLINLYSVLVLFIVKFHIALHRVKKENGNEE